MSESFNYAKTEGWVRQGEAKLLANQWQEALALFDKALADLGSLQIVSQEQAQSAAAILLAEAFNGRGVALLQMARLGEAIAAFSAAVELNPQLANAYFNRGLAVEALGPGRFIDALADYNRALELEPLDAEIYFQRGGLYFQRGDFGLAVADNTKVLELHASENLGEAIIGPYIARGLSYHQLGQLDRAQVDYTAAINIDQRAAADAYFYRALIHLDQEQLLSARADLQAFLNLTTDSCGELATQAREIIEELGEI